eukprot:SAG31_NODE_13997_length_833_cov_0.618529_1_plen_44_part_10
MSSPWQRLFAGKVASCMKWMHGQCHQLASKMGHEKEDTFAGIET